jgi:hypothetical protein
MWSLICLTFLRWGSQQRRFFNCLLQTKKCLTIPAQIRDHHVIGDYDPIGSYPGTSRGQSQIEHPVGMSEGRNAVKENDWSMRGVSNGNYPPGRGMRIGVVCHDGSFRYWEWDNGKGDFIALAL